MLICLSSYGNESKMPRQAIFYHLAMKNESKMPRQAIFCHPAMKNESKMPRQAIFCHPAMKVNQKWPAGPFLIRLDRGSIDVGSTTAVFGKLDRQSGPSGRRARLNPSVHRC